MGTDSQVGHGPKCLSSPYLFGLNPAHSGTLPIRDKSQDPSVELERSLGRGHWGEVTGGKGQSVLDDLCRRIGLELLG
jgi:hypothetical protein